MENFQIYLGVKKRIYVHSYKLYYTFEGCKNFIRFCGGFSRKNYDFEESF